MTIISLPCKPSVIRSKSAKPVPSPFKRALAAEKIFNRPDGLVDQFLGGHDAALRARFADAQNVALHLVQQRVHLALVIINPPDDFRAGLDHFPQQEFFPDDVEVIGQVRRARHRVLQLRQIGDAADLLQQLLVLEPLLQRDDVNRLARVDTSPPASRKWSDAAGRKTLPCRRLEFLDALAHALVRRKQHAAQHALLGFRGMRRQPVHVRAALRAAFCAPRLFQIRRGAGGVGNGINHAKRRPLIGSSDKPEFQTSVPNLFTKLFPGKIDSLLVVIRIPTRCKHETQTIVARHFPDGLH